MLRLAALAEFLSGAFEDSLGRWFFYEVVGSGLTVVALLVLKALLNRKHGFRALNWVLYAIAGVLGLLAVAWPLDSVAGAGGVIEAAIFALGCLVYALLYLYFSIRVLAWKANPHRLVTVHAVVTFIGLALALLGLTILGQPLVLAGEIVLSVFFIRLALRPAAEAAEDAQSKEDGKALRTRRIGVVVYMGLVVASSLLAWISNAVAQSEGSSHQDLGTAGATLISGPAWLLVEFTRMPETPGTLFAVSLAYFPFFWAPLGALLLWRRWWGLCVAVQVLFVALHLGLSLLLAYAMAMSG